MTTIAAAFGRVTPTEKQQEKVAADQKRLKEACADFEALLLHTMLKSMRKTLSGKDVFGGSLGRDIYESMYYQQVAVDVARGGSGLGIGDALYQELEQKMGLNRYADGEKFTKA